jgi:hypothetical protein
MFKQLQHENAELKRHQGIAGGAVLGTGNSGRSNVTQFGGSGGTTQMVWCGMRLLVLVIVLYEKTLSMPAPHSACMLS